MPDLIAILLKPLGPVAAAAAAPRFLASFTTSTFNSRLNLRLNITTSGFT